MAKQNKSNSKPISIQKIVLTAVFIAMGVALPQAFHATPFPGIMLLPMHIPILLCGLIIGFPYGLICGIIVPITSHLLFTMPPSAMLPAMICELAAYGLFAGLFMRIPARELYMKIHFALIGSMLLGRVVFGLVNALIFNIGEYSMQIWLAEAFVTSLAGIVIQIVLIPPIVLAIKKVRIN